MTGELDTRMRALATRLIDKYGKAVTLRRTVSSYDPATGKTTPTTTNHAVNGSPPSPVDEGRIDGTLVQEGDAEIILPAADLTVTPDPTTDLVVIDSVAWTVVAVSPIYSGELVAAFTVRVRR